MSEFIQKFTTHGAKHRPDAPTLIVEDVALAYAAVGERLKAGESSRFALEGVSFQIEKGEQVAIIGPNGSGKSTLLKLIAGILKPDRGRVVMSGHAPDEHICIAFVPQRNEIDRNFPATVSDVVMMGRVRQLGLFRRAGRRDWAFVRQCLQRVNADHLAGKQIGELSGGQQQRVFIARALAQEAELVLLDEPLTGLDVPSQQALFDIMDGLRPDGVTLLMATHDLNLAAERFDRVMLINRQVIAFGSPAEVLTPANLLTAYGGKQLAVSP